MCSEAMSCSRRLCRAFCNALERFELQRTTGSSFEKIGELCGLLSKASKNRSSARILRVEGRLGASGCSGQAMLVVGKSCGEILPGDRLVRENMACRVLSVEQGRELRLLLSEWKAV